MTDKTDPKAQTATISSATDTDSEATEQPIDDKHKDTKNKKEVVAKSKGNAFNFNQVSRNTFKQPPMTLH